MYARGRLFTNFILFYATCLKSIRCENESPDGYGYTWLMLVDDNSTTHVLNFSSLPHTGMRYGKPDFYLYTRNNPDIPELLTIPGKNETLKSKYFNGSNDIRVIAHGWMSDTRASWLQNIKDLLLLYYDVNVITIDWGYLAKNPIYPWSALSTRYVGKQTARLMDACTRSYGVERDRMHFIGHSLGAQIMGYAGMFMKGKVHRITGLDPARPMFEIPALPTDFMLERSDACFVDIIHTCGGLFGYQDSAGHADFYPNGGTPDQPGCPKKRELLNSCSHGRSAIYFGESIEYPRDRGFVAYPCESLEQFKSGLCTANKTIMGYLTATNIRGNYYLRTNNASKYAIDDEDFQ